MKTFLALNGIILALTASPTPPAAPIAPPTPCFVIDIAICSDCPAFHSYTCHVKAAGDITCTQLPPARKCTMADGSDGYCDEVNGTSGCQH